MDGQNNQQIPPMTELFKNYKERVEKGLISWSKSAEGTAVASFKRFDAALNEVLPPFRMEFSLRQLEKLKNDLSRRKLDLSDQVIALQTEIDRLDLELEGGWIDAIEADVRATEGK